MPDEETALHATPPQMSPQLDDGRKIMTSLPNNNNTNVGPIPHLTATNRATIRQSDPSLKKQPKPPPKLLHP